MITAPFNFVPLSDKVFFPDWAEKVSHDIPFEDAQSGEIDITITAKSPIFVRDGKDGERFCNHNGTYYIPGSSVKGMVRNVLEIMSFSKISFVDDDTYAVRDLRNRKLYMSKMTPDKTFCGWLKKVNDEYFIEDCGKPGRIKHSEIDKIYGINFASKFKHGRFGNKAKDKTAKIKYQMIPSDNFVHGFIYVKKDVNREIYKYDKNSNKKGTLVLTGQPSARKEPKGKKPSGKVYEFIFFESKGDIKLTKEVFENFKFAYFDGRKTEPKESPDWTFWKKKLEQGEKVPVFFQKNGKEIAHFGLSYLYKLPYSHSIKDGLPSIHKDNSRKDLAETIFGYVDNKDALKGRVQFSHFKAENAVELKPRTEILGTPRASYYPVYIKQNSTDYKTYMDSNFKIAGWKRYPIHKGSNVSKTTDTGNENVGTTFTPLKEGVVFKGKLRYHNLKKTELGAILSALTFHNTSQCYHNIGMAKSLGYGKIKIDIDGIDNIEDYLKEFELNISTQIENWANTPQLTELLSMAVEQNNSSNSSLNYMELDEFAKNKNEKDYLRNYTQLDNIRAVKAKSLISKEDIENLEQKIKERKEKELMLKKEQEELEKFNKEYQSTVNSNNIQKYESFLKKHQNKQDTQEFADIENKLTELKKIEEQNKEDKFKEINQKAQNAYNIMLKKKGKKGFEKERDKFIKKWSAEKNNKKSPNILALVEKAQKLK